MKVLHVCANPKPTEDSASKQLATSFFAKLVEIDPDIDIHNLDLYQDPPPYLSYEAIRGFYFPVYIQGYTATKEETAAMKYAMDQARLFNTADVVVLTMPMWNYAVPAIMKAWMDQIITPGATISMSKDDGIKPLHRVRKLVILVSSGGVYKEGDIRDSLTNQVEKLFAWIGISDIGIAWADGQDSFLFTEGEAHKGVAREAAQELAEEVAELAPAVG
jgi:FMN-dependent NADH-azoreductase